MAFPEGSVLGIDVSDLQDVRLEGNKVKGKSKYVSSFPKFSKNAKGNFLALKCEEATKGETINWELSQAKTKGTGTLDEDGILVVQLHSNTQTVTFKNGKTSKTLDLTALTLMPDVTQEMVTEALTSAATEVNKKMTYAQLAVEGTKATCTISDGSSKTVTNVYMDIISSIIEELKKNSDKFAKIKGKNGTKEVNITSDSVQATEIVALVKEVLPDVNPTDKIEKLYNKSVELTVVATDGDTFDYTLEFKNGSV